MINITVKKQLTSDKCYFSCKMIEYHKENHKDGNK